MRARAGGIVVAAGLLMGACGSGGADRAPSPGMTSPSSGSPSTGSPTAGVPVDPDPTLTARPPGGAQQVTGRVERGIETRCLVLSVEGGSTYVLTGAIAGLEPGDRVTVKGRPDPDATSTCQQGLVFVVAEIVTG